MNELSIMQKEKLKQVYKLSFLYGVMMDTIRVLVIIITIMTFKTSLNLGILTTIFAICTIISLYVFNKFYQKKYLKPLLIFCSVPVVLGVIGLLLNINKTTLIIYNFTYSITVYILEVMFKIKTDNIVREYNIEKMDSRISHLYRFLYGIRQNNRLSINASYRVNKQYCLF